MNNQQIEQYRKILAGAHPSDVEWMPHSKQYVPHWSTKSGDPLHLYRKIVDQYDENQALKARVDELESKLKNYEKEAIEIAKAQEQFAIEQQIKALEAISLYFSSDDGLDRKVVSHIESEIEQLRQQAKGE